MTTQAKTTELTDEGRVFLQQRVALFAKVALAISGLGLLARVLSSKPDQLLKPWFGLMLTASVLYTVAWLTCRRGERSVRFVRTIETLVICGMGVVIAPMGRLQLDSLVPEFLRGLSLSEGPVYVRLVALTQLYMTAGIMLGLTLCVVIRAALVPSRPLRTAWLTVAVGAPIAVVTALPRLPTEAPRSARTQVVAQMVAVDVIQVLIWWTMTTITCVAISKVIYGLHQEVREARQLGQYTLEDKLGEGGMGAVYRASHAMMRRPTAVKLLPPDKAGETNLARFEREVQLTARLTHPNTVTIFDYGRTPDGVFYYAMELLDGATLEDVVAVDGAQPPARVCKLLAEVAGALEEAHGIELIHRDIKPTNIIVCTQGGKLDVAKLVDFGLVKETRGQDDVKLTKESAVTGTPLYMPPEALTSPESIDARSDLYALGAVGYFLLTGQHVFDGRTVIEVCGHHMHAEPVPPSQRLGEPIPDGLEALILRCLEKSQADRPQSAAELLAALEGCADVGRWSEADGRRWWQEHADALKQLRGRDGGKSTTRTIAVALAR